MNNKIKIAVGLSGGVDSSVAAYILKKQGHDVTGITMRVCDGSKYPSGKNDKSACFGGDEEKDIEDARKIADFLGIPFHVIDLSSDYENEIIGYFRNEYIAGKTPNPCVKCNHTMKFGLLPQKAKESGIEFEYFATGHYAKIEFDKAKKIYTLKKAAFLDKDQTYFLSMLKQEQLKTSLFPLGGYTKDEVRQIAESINLFTSEKRESQNFYSGDYKELINGDEKEGEIVDLQGNVLGNHTGIWKYTVGQRKGLGISSERALYVVKLDKENNKVIVGDADKLFKSTFTVTKLNYLAIDKIAKPIRLKVKIRYAHKEEDATITPMADGKLKVTFDESQKAITSGQVAVFYNDDTVIASGYIENVEE